VPIGAGLSSSAAIEVATARAFCAAADVAPDSRELALICQRAENEFVGVNCGIMDQFVSVHAQAGHALMLDCRSLEHEQLPLDMDAFRVVVCNTMVHHELGSSEYNKRRARCEEAAATLNERADEDVEMLRDVTPEMLNRHGDALDEVTRKRARHVVTEIDRTERAAMALKAGDFHEFGRLMDASHESLRDDYEVSCEELDLMVEIARRQDGVYGARMTGDHADAVCSAIRGAYAEATGKDPEIYQFTATEGASVRPA
jgi:galactokinase